MIKNIKYFAHYRNLEREYDKNASVEYLVVKHHFECIKKAKWNALGRALKWPLYLLIGAGITYGTYYLDKKSPAAQEMRECLEKGEYKHPEECPGFRTR